MDLTWTQSINLIHHNLPPTFAENSFGLGSPASREEEEEEEEKEEEEEEKKKAAFAPHLSSPLDSCLGRNQPSGPTCGAGVPELQPAFPSLHCTALHLSS